MLKKFSVKNYRCFKDQTVIDFQTSHNYTFNTEYIRNGLTNKGVIIGSNGSGKTNFGFALFDIVSVLTDHMTHKLMTDPNSFLNGDSDEDSATFSYEFFNGEDTIVYEYRKTTPKTIVYERFDVNGETVFERSSHIRDYEVLREKFAPNLNIDIKDGSMSVLKYVSRSTLQPKDSPISFVIDFVDRMLYFKSDNTGNTFMGLSNEREYVMQYIMDSKLTAEFQNFINNMTEMNVVLDEYRMPDGQRRLYQKYKNKKIDFDANSSSGTKMLFLFFYWYKHFDDVSFLFMDEYDAFYHFELAQNVVNTVMGCEKIQTLITTHNTSLVNNKILRPDCYWIMGADHNLRALPESTDRELREGHSLERLYRNGEFDE